MRTRATTTAGPPQPRRARQGASCEPHQPWSIAADLRILPKALGDEYERENNRALVGGDRRGCLFYFLVILFIKWAVRREENDASLLACVWGWRHPAPLAAIR